MERFVVVVFFIALIMAAIFWLPEKLGLVLRATPERQPWLLLTRHPPFSIRSS